jgi:hypothetical protein
MKLIGGKELVSLTRTKKMNEKGEIFLADFPPMEITAAEDGEEFTLQFNTEQCSYDYSWRSNRWTGKNETHVIDIICVKQLPDDLFEVCSSCTSTPFVISSNHKKGKGKKEIDQSTTKKRKIQSAVFSDDLMSSGSTSSDTISVDGAVDGTSSVVNGAHNMDEVSETAIILTSLQNNYLDMIPSKMLEEMKHDPPSKIGCISPISRLHSRLSAEMIGEDDLIHMPMKVDRSLPVWSTDYSCPLGLP